jgi:hypothetical protein
MILTHIPLWSEEMLTERVALREILLRIRLLWWWVTHLRPNRSVYLPSLSYI